LPTRITETTASCIDHINTNSVGTEAISGILLCKLSDHLPVFLLTDCFRNKKKSDPYTITYRKFDDLSVLNFNKKLKELNWNQILCDFNPVTAFDSFFNLINDAFETIFPLSVMKIKNKNRVDNPWFSAGLEKSLKRKKN